MEPTVLSCPSCQRYYRPHPYDPTQTYSCKQCDGALVSDAAAPAPVLPAVPPPPRKSPAPRPKAKAPRRRAPILAASTALLLVAATSFVVLRSIRSKEAAITAAAQALKALRES